MKKGSCKAVVSSQAKWIEKKDLWSILNVKARVEVTALRNFQCITFNQVTYEVRE